MDPAKIFSDLVPPTEGKLYYLASPYSHSDPVIKEMQYTLVLAISAALTTLGYLLIEPIGSAHPVSRAYQLPTGYEYWQRRDRMMIDRSDGVIVCMMQGWETSVGVADEIKYALETGKPVYYLDPKEAIRYNITFN